MSRHVQIALFSVTLWLAPVAAEQLRVQLSIGQAAPAASRYYVRLAPSGGAELRNAAASGLEAGDSFRDGIWQGNAGAGDVDSVSFTLSYPTLDIRPIENLQVIWADLIAHSDADTVRRLAQDPAWRPDPRRLTIDMNAEGTRGFTLTVDQLLGQKAFWVPSLDLYLATGESPLPFAEHQHELERWRGQRILDRVHREPEAGYEQSKSRWQDMGSPEYIHPSQPEPGHIVCLTWDSALAKFGIDRGAGVWNDYGNPDRFRLWFNFSNLKEGIGPCWKGQRLERGLPVITTVIERDGVRYEVEQFAYPLGGPPPRRLGDLNMVLLGRVKLSDLSGRGRTVPVTMVHQRRFGPGADSGVIAQRDGEAWTFEDTAHRRTLLEVEPGGTALVWSGSRESESEFKTLSVTLLIDLRAGGSREFVVKLPSPAVEPAERPALVSLDPAAARAGTLAFWSQYLSRGAQFEVPEQPVNDLFRASLWHALRLPRRHAPAANGPVEIDLPYSNFAYDQHGTPWPVNQAVYVDYMLYGLRGYGGVAAEEIEAIYRNNQEYGGRVDGAAHWLVYTPGMLYAVAQNYLLSGDRESFERVLPQTLKALDWSLGEIRQAQSGGVSGLVAGPLNDGTGDGYWAFNQAYLYAGVELLGKALARLGHPRAGECFEAARTFRSAIERGFRLASVRSPLVPLRDHTWIPYVPCEATHYGRLFEQWYPTDVDTGAVHLLRLQALEPAGDLADSLLNDHEDNLFLHGWGIANEPVYNQQATAHLLRDDVPAVLKAFYGYMASAFSHSVFEPVEHRWRWGQYFGPPSTDGAWFELYRNMLVREVDDRTLLLAQATPRRWLEDGKKIEVRDAPTWFGKLSYGIESRAAAGTIVATVTLDARMPPETILLRLRHPQDRRLRQVTVDGRPWQDFDPDREWVRLKTGGGRNAYRVIASY